MKRKENVAKANLLHHSLYLPTPFSPCSASLFSPYPCTISYIDLISHWEYYQFHSNITGYFSFFSIHSYNCFEIQFSLIFSIWSNHKMLCFICLFAFNAHNSVSVDSWSLFFLFYPMHFLSNLFLLYFLTQSFPYNNLVRNTSILFILTNIPSL